MAFTYTFGITTAGSDGWYVVGGYTAYVLKCSPDYDGQITKLTVYVKNTMPWENVCTGAVWNSDNSFIVKKISEEAPAYHQGWIDVVFDSPIAIAGGQNYYIGACKALSSTMHIGYTTSGPYSGGWSVQSLPLGSLGGLSETSKRHKIYATYTAGPEDFTKRRGRALNNFTKFRSRAQGEVKKFRGLE